MWVLTPEQDSHASNRCRICGRKLTSPESIAVGIGCTCRQNIGMATIRIRKSKAQQERDKQQLELPWEERQA